MKEKNKTFVSFDTAYRQILESVTEGGLEMVPLGDAFGRILYQDIRSEINIPPLDNSAMDGFALHWSDTRGATRDSPVELRVCGEIQAGGDFNNVRVERRSAVRIMTGAPIPDGADAVIPVEYIQEDASRGTIAVLLELRQHENIRYAGEDIKAGQVVLTKGTKLRSAETGLLASLNISDIPVFQKPRVAIISTGDEIAEVGADLKPGQIRNSNAYTLSSEIKKYNGLPHYIGIAKDSMSDAKELFAKALEYDMVISTGGVSMGKYDLVKDVLRELGAEISLETIRMKPGKPVIFGSREKTLVFGLPGNPVSTMVSFIEFVRPALLKMSGARYLKKPELLAISDDDLNKKAGRREFLRGFFSIVDGMVHVTTTGPQGSGILRSMSEANCLIVLGEDSTGCRKGDRVLIQLINHEEFA
ncbi:MAG TPA: molybdopterin molybdotransferase MoeA [Spirochaetota bacterium]|nr:molybdopterin molybdotransferase MoeA [Spirochaetota bacterium]HPC39455.1 molybdopterin molybdotransferase MoeA [Spirochaetota bacterium]HPL15881.1 molybdopterin molybdotransferase MoeA [Spirochaetota bacterium]HQF06792.1 molybdopterin molybdotransferase MoeA [Spirochaetota bacterium]HQH95589.1 molybdopterin molybdotransferase MoeA [Spirochaetota bacterium]